MCFRATFYSSCLTSVSSFECLHLPHSSPSPPKGLKVKLSSNGVEGSLQKGLLKEKQSSREGRAMRGTTGEEAQVEERVKANLKITGITLDCLS